MIRETRTLVEQHWSEIEALAQRLLLEGRVNFLDNNFDIRQELRKRMSELAVKRASTSTTPIAQCAP